jgi:Family of unknown function (DUF6228)
MSEFTARSAVGDVEFRVAPSIGKPSYYYMVTLRSTAVSGRIEVYDDRASRLTEFFAELAESWWRGWDGEKTYESLEGHLCLVATRDAAGHVQLRVSLRDKMDGPDLRVAATLVVEAGQLETLAHEIHLALLEHGAA